MKHRMFRNSSKFGFLLAILILFVVGGLTTNNLGNFIASNAMVGHTLIVLEKLQETLALITDAETAQRGFILTGEEAYLEPYYLATEPETGIGHNLQTLRQATSNNPNQQARLDSLETVIADKLEFSRDTIEMRQESGLQAALEDIQTGRGRHLMDVIRLLIQEMEQEENTLLLLRSETATRNLIEARRMLITGALFSVSLLAYSFVAVNREVKERRHAENDLFDLNRSLDNQILERTAELTQALTRVHEELARRENAEKELQIQLDFANQVLNTMGQGLTVSDSDFRFIYVNPAYAQMIGLAPEEILGKHSLDFTTPEDHPFLLDQLALRQKGESSAYEVRLIHADGHLIPVQITGVPRWQQGESAGFIAAVTDMTIHKQMEEKLRRNEAILLQTGRMAKIGGWELELETMTLVWTEVTYSIHEVDPSEEPNLENAIHFYAPEARPVITEAVRRAMEEGMAYDLELPFITAKGNHIWVRTRGVPEMRDGKCVRLFGTFQDITTRKQSEQQIEKQLKRVETLRAIDEAILVTTELRSMLKAILRETKVHLQADGVGVYLFNPHNLMLEPAVFDGNRNRDSEQVTIRLGEGVSGKAALERRTMVFPNLDVEALPRHIRNPVIMEGIQSLYSTPLIAKGNLIGVLNTIFRTPFQADQEWIDFFEALAGQTAIAVEGGKLFEELQRSNMNLKLAYETTIEGWSRALDLRDKET
jgi:PAS domain S-box-containing protein